ncbi:hypothetical protein EVAR_71557_1 [Eumeta japonica]|uniref:MADF domain-containing protein n=1 Tax=Eumeta variegata TaxID=151549 RepID=A0A4C1SIW2_EUMVA|nr:hypothetical protein EVAR_71557_1 [Eumeta japonica]
MDDEKLILLVQERDEIYNKLNPRFKLAEKKADAWMDIAAEMGVADKSFCEAVEALKRACALNEARHKNPAVHAFGEMIVSTICSMNSRNQLKAMQQVTDTVMKIKLQEDELTEEQSYTKF